MFFRVSPALVAFGASVLLLVGLVGALYWIGPSQSEGDGGPPLEIYCAAAMRLPIEAIASEYEKQFGQKVILHPGPSQTILFQLEQVKKGDLFLPADESYIEAATSKDLVTNINPVARMKAVLIVRPGLGRTIKTWADFIAPENKIGLANSEVTAIGKLTRQHLVKAGLWEALHARKPTYLGDVNEVGNSIANPKLGTSDVGITWDALALALQKKNPDLKIVPLDELAGIQAHVKIAIAKASKQPENALRFIGFLCDRPESLDQLQKSGYTVDRGTPPKVPSQAVKKESGPRELTVYAGSIDRATPAKLPVPAPKKESGARELTVYAGSMLRPAVEEALIEFEKKENCKITRVYNGCGILVTQMKAGQMPDVYFACDTSFMLQVKDKFEEATNVSNNQLVIAVKKGNPHQVTKLLDLGKQGLRVGVGHEHQCALGALTKETFIRSGVYAKVMKNVVVQSPTGDFLVNQLRVGALDVVVAYRSNVLPYEKDIEGIPITGIPCATPSQPLAVSKSSTHPELSRRLMEFLQTEESRRRFEESGFGWELKVADK